MPVLTEILRLRSSPALAIDSSTPPRLRSGLVLAPPKICHHKSSSLPDHHRGPTAGSCPQGHFAVGEAARARTEPCHS